MSVILLLALTSFFIALVFLIAFIRSVKHGQFDDSISPAVRILIDLKTNKNNQINTSKKTTIKK